MVKLWQHFGDDEEFHLIINSLKAYKCKSVQELAQTLSIKLYIIPSGVTDQFQSLDRRDFGCLKATAHSLKKLTLIPQQKHFLNWLLHNT